STTPIQPTDQYLRCKYCHSMMCINLGESLLKTTFTIKIDEDSLLGIIKKTLRDHDLLETFTLNSVHLFYFPYWQFQSSHKTFYIPAASTTYRTIETYSVEPGEIRFYSQDIQESASSVNPDVFLETALETLHDQMIDTVEDVKASLIYIPFYSVFIKYGDRNYTLHIPAHSGTVLMTDLLPPPSLNLYRSLRLSALIIFFFYVFLTFGAINLSGRLSIAFITCVLASFVFYKWLKKSIVR
ncbi:hypothetical protein JW979_10670, partial [bacterium]|nr:hypothetical protein [candidate division CSSED10-310 bacterium]